MKTDDKPSGQASAADVGNLLKTCKVSELHACKRAGMPTSTLHRWRRGSVPRQFRVDMLRRAIMEIALEAGTLPAEYGAQLAELRAAVALPERKQDLASRVDRLERAVTEHLGAVL